MRGETPMRPVGVSSRPSTCGNSPLIRAAPPPTFSLKGRRNRTPLPPRVFSPFSTPNSVFSPLPGETIPPCVRI